LQNCNIFNDGAWESLTDKGLRDDNTISLEHGQPLVFGKDRDKGIRRKGLELEVVTLGNGVTEEDLVVHDERNPNPAYAFLLSRMDARPDFPTPIGVLRAVEAPSYEQEVREQLEDVTRRKGEGDLAALLRAGDTWEVA
jgi:2-oxoglutarate ferredoxin oxidoreductase subunit beta